MNSNTVGNKIRRFRELREYSQEYMANKLEITQSAYGKIENESVKITIERLQKIAEILNVELSNLINSNNQNIFNQCNNHTANGYIENQYNDLKEAYNQIIKSKDEQIELLKKMLENK